MEKERLFNGVLFYAYGAFCDFESECGYVDFNFKSNSESMEDVITEASKYLRKEYSCYPTVYIVEIHESFKNQKVFNLDAKECTQKYVLDLLSDAGYKTKDGFRVSSDSEISFPISFNTRKKELYRSIKNNPFTTVGKLKEILFDDIISYKNNRINTMNSLCKKSENKQTELENAINVLNDTIYNLRECLNDTEKELTKLNK